MAKKIAANQRKSEGSFVPRKGSKAQKAGIGLVYELPVPSGYVYLHTVQLLKSPKNFPLVRALDLSRRRVSCTEELLNANELFVFMFVIDTLPKQTRGVSVVGTLPIPDRWKNPSALLMRSLSRDRKNEPQWIIRAPQSKDGMVSKPLSQLTAEERALPCNEIWNLLELIKRVEAEWSMELELPRHQGQETRKELAFEKKYGSLKGPELRKLVDSHWGRKASATKSRAR
jgi:hypothetical protein